MKDRAEEEAIRTEVHPPTRDKRPTSTYADTVGTRYGMVYAIDGDRPLTADLFLSRRVPESKRPAIVFLHGGCWYFGEPSQFHHHSFYLAGRHDFVCMCVDYRLSWEARFPAALHDAKCAIRWLRAHANTLNIDTERIAIAGGSAGAHLASMVMTTAGIDKYEGGGGFLDYSSHADCGILFNGEFDIGDLVQKGSLIGPIKQFIGGDPAGEMAHLCNELSTIHRIHSQCPPSLLLHGTADDSVSHEQSVAFHKKMLENGVHSELEIYQGKPHAWFNFEPDRTLTMKRMEQFLVQQFRLS